MSGAQDVVRFGDDRLEIEVLPGAGARLHRIRAFGHDLLRTPDDPSRHVDDRFFWGGYVMAPWCNRIEARPQSVAGRVIDLPSNFPDGTVIHGQVHVVPWTRRPDDTFEVEAGGDGWPWRYGVRLAVTVDGQRARLAYSLTNLDDAPMPAGIGVHPWFVGADDVVFRASRVFRDNGDTTPEPEAVSGPWDRRTGGPMPAGLDATWLADERAAVRIGWSAAGIVLEMSTDRDGACIVAASPADVPAVAIEPETHAPQALRRLARGEPAGLELLGPGETLDLVVELVVSRTA